jgi:hypothetical protein
MMAKSSIVLTLGDDNRDFSSLHYNPLYLVSPSGRVNDCEAREVVGGA